MTRASSRAEHYELALKRNLAAELSDDLDLCPECSRGWVIPDTKGARFGICQKCYFRHLAEAQKLAAAEMEARREYDKERQRVCRLRKAGKNANQSA